MAKRAALLAPLGRLLIIVPTERAAWCAAALAPVALVIAATAPGAWVIAPLLGGVLLALVVVDALLSGRNRGVQPALLPLVLRRASRLRTSASMRWRRAGSGGCQLAPALRAM